MGKLLPLEKGSKRTLTGAKHGYGTNMKHRFNLVQLKNKFFSPLKLVKNTKCSLEVYKAGLILSGDFCENYKHISVLSNEVCSIDLVRGNETIDTFYLSPIHILTKLGLPNSLVRYFRVHATEYDIKQTKIIIDSKDQLFELITSGYRFEKLLRLFKKMGYQDRLTVQRKASIDVSHFKNAISNQEKSIF